MELKKLSIEDWALGIKQNRRGDILSLFTLCALTSRHAVVHLRNGNLWTTVNTPDSYDHDALLSICDVHLAYVGNGQFAELRCKSATPSHDLPKNPGDAQGTMCTVQGEDELHASTLSSSTGTTTGTTSTSNGTTTRSATKNTSIPASPEPDIIIQTLGTIKSDPDTLDKLLARTSNQKQVSNPVNIHRLTESNVIKPSYVRLRKLNKADIQLWRKVGKSKVDDLLKERPMLANVNPDGTRNTRGISSHRQALSTSLKLKLKSPFKKTDKRKAKIRPISPKPSSRTTRAQKICKGMKSPTFRITVHGLKCFKHRYSYKCMVNPCNRCFATVRDWNRHH